MFAIRRPFLGLLTALAFGLSAMAVGSALAQQAPPAPLKTATAKSWVLFSLMPRG